MKATAGSEKVRPFDFVSFGVRVRIEGDTQDLVDLAETHARKALVDNVAPAVGQDFNVLFDIHHKDGTFEITQDGEAAASDPNPEFFFRYFNSLVRIAVAERATGLVFMHAGAVAWKGKGIIFPGESFVGKSTLVAELVRQGATYYSDDYAIFDPEGRLHPFPRGLSMRSDDGRYTRFELPPDSIGSVGREPVEVGAVIMTRYEPDAVWSPQILTPGGGVMEMIPYTFAFKDRPDFSLPVLNKIAERAIILSSLRGSAENFAKIVLEFVDKNEV